MPDSDNFTLPARNSYDQISNSFGNKLLSLCKQTSLYIANGRLEPGNFTCYNLIRNRFSASVVDYIICNSTLYSIIDNMCVHDLTEYSDHCPVTCTLAFVTVNEFITEDVLYEKIVWENSNNDIFLHKLDHSRYLFDNLVENLCSGVIHINNV